MLFADRLRSRVERVQMLVGGLREHQGAVALVTVGLGGVECLVLSVVSQSSARGVQSRAMVADERAIGERFRDGGIA